MKRLICQKGTAVVEFALVLPILIILAFGIIEFSLLLYDKQVITNASREGARTGIVSQSPRVSDGEIAGVVNSYCASHLITFGEGNSPTTTVTRTGYNFGDKLTVTVAYTYNFLMIPNLVSDLVGCSNLVAETVMRME